MTDVVIIGAGQAGAEAALALRQLKHSGAITIIGDEALAPYSRPPLSKDYLLGSLPVERLPLRSAEAYARAEIDLVLGDAVTAIHPQSRKVELGSGRTLSYGACIIATGAAARRPAIAGADLKGVEVLRDAADGDRLRQMIRPGARLVVMGAGYLGLEVAASARKLGADVTVLEAAPRLLARSTSGLTSQALAARHRLEGVDLRLGIGVEAILGTAEGQLRALCLTDGTEIGADCLVLAIGASPRTALAEAAGLICHNGILVDADTRSSQPDIYAIGDCANWDLGDGRGPLRLESVQMASQGARVAAAAIAGAARPSVKLPYFWSNQFDLKLQIAGIVPQGAACDDHLEGDTTGAFAVSRYVDGVLAAVETVNMPARYIEAQRAIGVKRLETV